MHASFFRGFCLKRLCAPKRAETKVACQCKANFRGYYHNNLKENRWNFRSRERVEINWAKTVIKIGGNKQSVVELGCRSVVLVVPARGLCPCPCHSGSSSAQLSCTTVLLSWGLLQGVRRFTKDKGIRNSFVLMSAQKPVLCRWISGRWRHSEWLIFVVFRGKTFILLFGKSNWINLAVLFGHRKASLAL